MKRKAEREFRRAVDRVRARLAELAEKHGGEFFWRNGVIRQSWLHPTKGWRARRWEAWPVAQIAERVIRAEGAGK